MAMANYLEDVADPTTDAMIRAGMVPRSPTLAEILKSQIDDNRLKASAVKISEGPRPANTAGAGLTQEERTALDAPTDSRRDVLLPVRAQVGAGPYGLPSLPSLPPPNASGDQFPYGRPRFPNLDLRAYFDPRTNESYRNEGDLSRLMEALSWAGGHSLK
jgi:hypothetical protein